MKSLNTRISTLLNHSGFRKYASNTGWLIGEKVLRMVVGLFVGVWVTRYLGPEKYGLLSYAQSFVALFTAVATLGLNGIIVRELVKDETKRDVLLGTAFGLKLMGAFGVLLLLTIAVNFTSNDAYTNTIILIIGTGTIFQSFNVVDCYFQSKVLSRYVVFANLISLSLSSIIKVSLILNEAPLVAFATIVVFDYAVLASGLIYFFYHNNLPFKSWFFDWNEARNLLKYSWPLIISGLSVGFGLRFDQILLKEMMNSEEVGIYAAGVRIAEPLSIIPMFIMQSFFPKMISMDYEKEKSIFIGLMRYVFYGLFVLAVWIMIFSNEMISVLYSKEFYRAGDVLSVLIFTIPITFLNIFNSKLLLKKASQNLIMLRQIVLVLLNVFLDLLLIPSYGIIGAAFATLLADVFVGLVLDVVNKGTRFLFFLKIEALFFLRLENK